MLKKRVRMHNSWKKLAPYTATTGPNAIGRKSG
jgi:hypothetical protein